MKRSVSFAARIVLAVLVMVIVVVMGKISVAGAQPVTNRPAAVSAPVPENAYGRSHLFQDLYGACAEGYEAEQIACDERGAACPPNRVFRSGCGIRLLGEFNSLESKLIPGVASANVVLPGAVALANLRALEGHCDQRMAVVPDGGVSVGDAGVRIVHHTFNFEEGRIRGNMRNPLAWFPSYCESAKMIEVKARVSLVCPPSSVRRPTRILRESQADVLSARNPEQMTVALMAVRNGGVFSNSLNELAAARDLNALAQRLVEVVFGWNARSKAWVEAARTQERAMCEVGRRADAGREARQEREFQGVVKLFGALFTLIFLMALRTLVTRGLEVRRIRNFRKKGGRTFKELYDEAFRRGQGLVEDLDRAHARVHELESGTALVEGAQAKIDAAKEAKEAAEARVTALLKEIDGMVFKHSLALGAARIEGSASRDADVAHARAQIEALRVTFDADRASWAAEKAALRASLDAGREAALIAESQAVTATLMAERAAWEVERQEMTLALIRAGMDCKNTSDRATALEKLLKAHPDADLHQETGVYVAASAPAPAQAVEEDAVAPIVEAPGALVNPEEPAAAAPPSGSGTESGEGGDEDADPVVQTSDSSPDDLAQVERAVGEAAVAESTSEGGRATAAETDSVMEEGASVTSRILVRLDGRLGMFDDEGVFVPVPGHHQQGPTAKIEAVPMSVDSSSLVPPEVAERSTGSSSTPPPAEQVTGRDSSCFSLPWGEHRTDPGPLALAMRADGSEPGVDEPTPRGGLGPQMRDGLPEVLGGNPDAPRTTMGYGT